MTRPRAEARSALRDVAAFLILADIAVLSLHILRRLPLPGGFGLPAPGPFWSLTDQTGMASSLELAQMTLASLVLMLAAWRRPTPAVLLAALALSILTLTETFDLHIRLGRELRFVARALAEAGWPLPGAPALLGAVTMGGLALGLACLAGAAAEGRHERRIARQVLIVLVLFLGLGGGFDLLGKLAVALRPPLEVAEETAELLIATFACVRLLRPCWQWRADPCARPGRAPSGGLQPASANSRGLR